MTVSRLDETYATDHTSTKIIGDHAWSEIMNIDLRRIETKCHRKRSYRPYAQERRITPSRPYNADGRYARIQKQ